MCCAPSVSLPVCVRPIAVVCLSQHADEEVALQSADFWQAFCEAQLDPDLLRPFLPKLIPLLMKNMVSEGAAGVHLHTSEPSLDAVSRKWAWIDKVCVCVISGSIEAPSADKYDSCHDSLHA